MLLPSKILVAPLDVGGVEVVKLIGLTTNGRTVISWRPVGWLSVSDVSWCQCSSMTPVRLTAAARGASRLQPTLGINHLCTIQALAQPEMSIGGRLPSPPLSFPFSSLSFFPPFLPISFFFCFLLFPSPSFP